MLVLCMALGLAATGCGFESAEVPDNSTTDTSGNSTAVQGAVADDAPYQDIYAYIQTPSDNPDKVTIRYATMASEDTLYGQAYTRGYVMMLKWLTYDSFFYFNPCYNN